MLPALKNNLMRLWRGTLRKHRSPHLHGESISRALSSYSLRRGQTLLMHSSLSSCGYIKGGAATVIQAVQDWSGHALLAMPTHSYCYPQLSSPAPVFDPSKTPSKVGAISEYFRKQPSVRRSLHPTHSIACQGPGADALAAGHELCDTPCGAGSPYAKLVQCDAAVLMFGVSLESCTLFHTAEDAADVPYLYHREPCSLRFLNPDGTIAAYTMRRQNMQVERRFAEMDHWLEQRGLLRRIPLGSGTLLLIPSALAMHTTLVAELRQDPTLLLKYPLGSQTLLPPT